MESIDTLAGDFRVGEAVGAAQAIAETLPQINDKLKVLEAALNRVAAGEVEQEEIDERAYGYIPIDLNEFFDCMFVLEAVLTADPDYAHSELRHKRCDFVEIGCGSGRNAFLMASTDRFEFGRVHGFDVSERLIEWGRRAFGMGDDLFVADCMQIDYSAYDVAYFYRPFSDTDAQIAFEKHLINSLKPGAYIIGCSHLSLEKERRLIGKDDHGRIWKKA